MVEIHPHVFDPQTEECKFCHRTRQQITEEPNRKPRFGDLGRYIVGDGPTAFTVTGTYSDLAWIKEVIEHQTEYGKAWLITPAAGGNI